MKYFTWLLFLLVSCKQKENDNPLTGKWEYEKMEMTDGTPINLEDSMINNLHQQQRGLTFTFSGKNKFKVTHKRENNREEFVAEQPYELLDSNKTLRLKNAGRTDDNFPIIALTDRLLKINIFYSDKAYMVFTKKN